jgi:superfamily II DNA or RNA helicase
MLSGIKKPANVVLKYYLTLNLTLVIIDTILYISIAMTINSTEFQQKVGYYLRLAESGTVLTIVKSKPKHSSYQLKIIAENRKNPSKEKLEKFFKKVDSAGAKFDFYGKDSVKFVRDIRK